MELTTDQRPLTLLDAYVSLYLVDASGVATTEVFLGGSPKKLLCDGTRKERVLAWPGEAYGRAYQEDEEHSIELQNVWLHDRSQFLPRMPTTQRNARYQMVILWQDVETGVFNKRVYSGVTAQPNRVEDTLQTIRFRAESLREIPGVGEGDLTPGDGAVVYVDTDGSALDLYTYDGQSYHAVADSLLTGRALIDLTTVDQCSITFAGVIALRADAGGLHVKSFDAVGATFLDAVPRLEWWTGGARVASLSAAGALAVVEVIETEEAPGLGFDVSNPDWLFSLGGPTAAAFAPAFSDDL